MTIKISDVGTLSDNDIKKLCANGQLILENYLEDNVKQACYELRASNIYYDLAGDKVKHTVAVGDYILLKPRQLIVIITLESLSLPPNILGRILTKGKLFSVGILPVNTYADPGFRGNLGMVFYNLSNNFLKVFPSQAIAKIEFSRLLDPVAVPYHGQHGYETEIWPVPEDMILTQAEITNDRRIKKPSEEVLLSYGKSIGDVINRVFSFERYLIFCTIAYLMFSAILLIIVGFKSEWVTPLLAVILGVVSNVIFGILTYGATNLRR